MGKIVKTCGSCTHYRIPFDEIGLGRCHRFPPVKSDGSWDVPKTGKYGVCGEHNQREKKCFLTRWLLNFAAYLKC